MLKRLFEPLKIRDLKIKNRIFSSGHQTVLVNDGVPNDALIAYHRARAAGGAGLIVTEIAAVHETAFFSTHTIKGYDDACIPGYAELARTVHEFGCAIFSQLFHPGREVYGILPDGRRPVSYAPSASSPERYLTSPRAMDPSLIGEVVAGYAAAAARMQRAGLDGVEVVASHGYLPAQFLNPRVNRRTDRYGGSSESRLRFLTEVLTAIRAAVGPELIVGLRISADEETEDGLKKEEVAPAVEALVTATLLDYVNVIAGSSSTSRGAIHIVPPMKIPPGYVAPLASYIKRRVSVPVLVAGRINDPGIAERIISDDQADMCGMTRAMICDPNLATKAMTGHSEDIRACIGCNQACIGHMQIDAPISCIQTPESGRELKFPAPTPISLKRHVAIVGGGPAGMRAAATAARRGHRVDLFEASRHLGGQARLASALPGRAEFGGLVTNLQRELSLSDAHISVGKAVTVQDLKTLRPDIIILATGAKPRALTEAQRDENVLDACDVLRGERLPGQRVAVVDWRGDWIGFGVAELLARSGRVVSYFTSGSAPGASLQSYLRDQWIGELFGLGVEIKTHHRFFALQERTAYFQHTANDAPIEVAEVDSVIAALGYESVSTLEGELKDWPDPIRTIGDCFAPRTAEEAIYEGFEAGYTI